MPIRPAPTVLIVAALMLGACGTRGPLTLTPPQQAELRAQQQARQKAAEQAQQLEKEKQGQTAKTESPIAVPAVDTNTTKEPLR